MNLNYVFGHGDKSKKIMYQIIYLVLVGLQLCCNCLICTMYCSLRPAKNQKQLLLLAYLSFSKLSDQIQLVSQPFNNSIPLMLMDQFQLIQKLQVYLVIFLYGGIGMLRLSLARLRFQLVILIPCYSKSYLEGKQQFPQPISNAWYQLTYRRPRSTLVS